MTRQQYLVWFDEVMAPTVPMMKLVPADRLGWKLTDKSFSLGQQLDHLGKAVIFNAKVIAQETVPAKSVRDILLLNRRTPEASVDQAIAQFESGCRRWKDTVSGLSEEDFQKRDIITPQFGEVNIWRFAAFLLEHHIHHLMELHLSLKVLGITVHTGTLYSRLR